MVIGSGISSQLGMKAETVYGTEVVVDRFLEYNSESITPDVKVMNSMGMMAGASRFQRTDRTARVVAGFGGDIEFDVMNKDFGLVFEQAMGQNTVSGASANKTHTIIPDALAQQGKHATVQISKPSIDGTNNVFTYIGGKCTGFSLEQAMDEILKLTTTWDFKTGDVNTTLASASYTATREPYHSGELAVTVGGSAFSAQSMSLQYAPGLNTDRRFMGNAKKEPLAAEQASITGELGSEFESLTHYNSYLAGTQQALVFTWTKATVIPTTAVAYSITITIPKADFTQVNPNVEGFDIIRPPIQWRALYDGTNPVMTIAIVTSDTAS